MGKYDDIYPRGVVIDWAQSPVRLHPGVPQEAQEHAVFWLNRNGILYKTIQDALYWSGSLTPELNLSPGEKAFFHSANLSPDFVELVREEDALFASSVPYNRYYRVSTIDVPYALSISASPGDHSTIWISKSGRPYATRNLALEDDLAKSIVHPQSVQPAPAVVPTMLDDTAEFLFGSTFGWLVLLFIAFLLIRLFKKGSPAPAAPKSVNPKIENVS
ncbi:MAG: hypothetical protein LBU42_10100 [Prevotellaceae bacterium]|jgi:hypothetical protein|nr:hypothetical protein [Prevotellaceae bacterium]